jgi:hypothetical protein
MYVVIPKGTNIPINPVGPPISLDDDIGGSIYMDAAVWIDQGRIFGFAACEYFSAMKSNNLYSIHSTGTVTGWMIKGSAEIDLIFR